MTMWREWSLEVLQWLSDLGYPGIMLGLMVEVIPSELVLAFGGYMVKEGVLRYWGVVVYGTIGGTIAQYFLYAMGRWGGRPFLEKFGKYIFLHKSHLDKAENWFHQYGDGIVFFGRFIPVVRHAISVPAGLAGMPQARFLLLTMAAVWPWSMFFVYLGMELGKNWREIKTMIAPYFPFLIVLSVLLIVFYILYKRIRTR